MPLITGSRIQQITFDDIDGFDTINIYNGAQKYETSFATYLNIDQICQLITFLEEQLKKAGHDLP